MKHEHKSFAAPAKVNGNVRNAYGGGNLVVDRVRRFQPMVRRLAWHVHGSGRSGIELDDLMQAGLVALTECAQKHDNPCEDGFAAYAKLRVRGAMVDLIRRATPLARPAADRRRQLRGHEATLATRLGRPGTEAELATELKMTPRELAQLRAACEPVRIEPIDDAYSDSNLAFADNRPDSFAMLANQQMRAELASAIGALPERLQTIVQLYFVEELNLHEIAETLEVSVPRVHQLKAQALDKLRGMLSEDMVLL